MVLLLNAAGSAGALAAPRLAPVPAGFTDNLLANVSRPTGLAFTPDGRLLITSQSGQVWVYHNGVLRPQPALDLAPVLCDNWERGLAGVAVDPDFANNQYIYLYYTFNKSDACPNADPFNPDNPVNRVARFTLPASNDILTSTETVLIDNIPQRFGIHNGGDMHFGADGWLYITTGDGGIYPYARALDLLAGKVLRIGSDGSIPPDNPYAAAGDSRQCGDPAGVPAGTGPCREIYASGLRNPFRMAFKPGLNEFYVNDVGQATWEEINVGAQQADYGWHVREGPCPFTTPNCNPAENPNPAGLAAPIYYYHHNTGCYSITGAAFVPPGIWPVEYDNAYLFGDFGCGRMWRLAGSGSGASAIEFATGLGANSVVSMLFGPHEETQALYYTTYAGTFFGAEGELRRIAYTGPTNQAPTAALAADPVYGAAPLEVALSAEGSADPNAADTLFYDWDLGDGTVLTGSTSVTLTHIYAAGVYTASLRVRDNRGATADMLRVRIDSGNTPPVPVIARVGPDTPFAVGELLDWVGTVTDTEDVESPALTWEARLYHIDAALPGNTHFHPYLAVTPGTTISFTAPAPEDFGAAALSFVELRLTATDSWGLTAVVTEVVEASLVAVNFEVTPPGFELVLRGQVINTPHNATSWENWAFEVEAPLQTDAVGDRWGWAGWEVGEGLTATRTITTPAVATTYTATFAPTDEAPVPQVIQLQPASALSGQVAVPFTLTVTGKNFASGAEVLWNGVPLTPTIFVNNTELQAWVSAELLSEPGPVPVSVFNPAPGGGAAEAVNFVRLWVLWLTWVGVGGP